MDFTNIDIIKVISIFMAAVVAIVGHEFSHGYIAYKFGDNTAKSMGRLSLNPLVHVDLIGTIIVPVLLYLSSGFAFGWAKPVPVNIRTVYQNGGYKACLYVALAGIIYNIFVAILSLFLLDTFKGYIDFEVSKFLFILFAVNLFLALFNLYPVPPLDGSKALIYVLKMLNFSNFANKIYSFERYGTVFLIIILISPLSKYFFAPIDYVFQLFLKMM